VHRIVAPQLIAFSNGVSDSYNHPEGVAPAIVQPVAVLMVNLRPIGTEVFVHLNLRAFNPCNHVGRPLSIFICVSVMSPYSVKIFSRYLAFENRPVSTL